MFFNSRYVGILSASLLLSPGISFGQTVVSHPSLSQQNNQSGSFYAPAVEQSIADNFSKMTTDQRKKFVESNQARLTDYTAKLNASQTDTDKKKWSKEISRVSANIAIMNKVIAKLDSGNSAQGGAVPNGVVPNGAVPNGAVPNGAAPNGVAPNGAAPNGAVPNGAAPNGAVPNGAVPNGAVPNGAAPNGAVPNGAVPNGAVPNGAVPNGAVPSIQQPSSSASTSSSSSNWTVNEKSDWSALVAASEMAQSDIDKTILSISSLTKDAADKFVNDAKKMIDYNNQQLKGQPQTARNSKFNRDNAISLIKVLIATHDPRVPQVAAFVPPIANLDDNTPWDDLVKVGITQAGQLETLINSISLLSDQDKKTQLDDAIKSVEKNRQKFQNAKTDLERRSTYTWLAGSLVRQRILEGKYPH